MKWLWLDLQSLKEENIDLHEHSQAFLGLLEQLFFTRPADRADRARASLKTMDLLHVLHLGQTFHYLWNLI